MTTCLTVTCTSTAPVHPFPQGSYCETCRPPLPAPRPEWTLAGIRAAKGLATPLVPLSTSALLDEQAVTSGKSARGRVPDGWRNRTEGGVMSGHEPGRTGQVTE